MESQQFNLRLDPSTAAALKRLAQSTQRSQAGVIRWLILTEAERRLAQAEAWRQMAGNCFANSAVRSGVPAVVLGMGTIPCADSSTPAARLPSPTNVIDVSGLAIVAALSRDWGSTPTASGKTVWAIIGPENQL